MKIILNVDGMMCNMCESHVNDKIRQSFKVKKVKSSHKKGTTIITTEDDIADEDIILAMKDTGYKITDIRRE